MTDKKFNPITEAYPELVELIPKFVKNKLTELSLARDAFDRGDWQGVARFGHTVAGDSLPYGFDHITETGRELEDLAEAPDKAVDQMKALMDKIEAVLREHQS